MLLENLTSPALGRVDRATPVILPMAAVEQHGPHLPLSTDRRIIEHFCSELDRRDPSLALVLPTVCVGVSEHHMTFAGSLTLRHDTFRAHCLDLLRSARRHGFRNFLLFNGHGGNQSIGGVVLEEFGAENTDGRTVFTSWWRLAAPELLSITETGPGGIGHACEFETSLMQLIAPELVDMENIPERANTPTPEWNASDMLRGSRASIYRSLAEQTPTGVFGTPRASSPEKGVRITKAVADAAERILHDLASGKCGLA